MSRNGSSPGAPAGQTRYVWYKDLTRYHWFVLSVAIMGWMFDTMAQQLFNLARKPALRELLGGRASDATVSEQAGYATMIFMIGWALGGVVFGILGDRLGRAKTMIMTILCYSIFTGLSVLSTSVWDFNLYRLLCGLGVGGQFAVGVALVAEVVPERARPNALGMVQAFSAVGNMLAALVGILLGQLEMSGAIVGAWRWEFLAGALPAPLALLVFKKLKEPEQWLKARAAKKRLGSVGELFSTPRWRRNAIVGFLLAFAGVVGLWGIAFFSYDLLRPVLEQTFRAQGITGAELAGKTTTWIGITSLLQNLGGFFGVYAFTRLTQRTGRKPAFAISFLAAMGVTAYTFWNLKNVSDIFWMIPLMGFAQMALFGGYAIYLPELFPTRLRSTGTSFCYNVGRFAAAAGPLTLGLLTSRVFAGYAQPMRYAGVTMCLVFLVGLAALPFAPETNGQPLPE
jgi:MFS family permease